MRKSSWWRQRGVYVAMCVRAGPLPARPSAGRLCFLWVDFKRHAPVLPPPGNIPVSGALRALQRALPISEPPYSYFNNCVSIVSSFFCLQTSV